LGLKRAVRWWRRRKDSVRVVAILAAFNEERFIAGCLEHLFGQGVEAYLIDNSSTDRTVEIAERYLKRGLIGIETFPRAEGTYKWRPILERKAQIAATLEADWFMHVDADEIRLPPRSDRTLAQAFSEVEAQGYNAVNFLEFVFVPTREAPDHDHPRFQETMRWYYPFARTFPQRRNAWKQQPEKVDLARSGGHRVRFPGLRMYPESFKMRHYVFLSVPHALSKYINRKYDAAEVESGMHRMRASLTPEKIKLPSQKELRPYTSDDELDPSNPLVQHLWALPQEE
jgi:glycosyltransferase involved in cell wall biosynthesis